MLYWYEDGLPRKRYTKPIEQITVRISTDAYEVLDGCREGRLREPKYITLDRVLTEYLHTRGIIHKLNGELEEKDYVIQDLKGRLESRRKEIELIQKSKKD